MRLDIPATKRAALLFAQIQQLLALDSISTAALTSKEALSGQDLEQIGIAVQEMKILLSHCASEAAWFNGLLLPHFEDFRSELRQAIRTAPLADSLRETLDTRLVVEGRAEKLIRQGPTELARLAGLEAVHLTSQLELARKQLPTEGDLRPETVCLLAGIGLGVGIGLGQPSIIISMGVLISRDCI
jgi:hypothetical protein